MSLGEWLLVGGVASMALGAIVHAVWEPRDEVGASRVFLMLAILLFIVGGIASV